MKILFRTLPFLIIFLGTTELFIRFFVYESVYRDGKCNKNFFPKTDSELRRLFYPNCREEIQLPDGKLITLETNEDGFRDRPRSEFSKGAIALLGDSHVEGFALSAETALSRQLENTKMFKRKILNIGYRATGPDEQLRILSYANGRYKLDGLIWLLTENDILDDLYLRTRNPKFWATRLNIFFLQVSEKVFSRKYLTLEYLRVAMNGFALAHAAQAPEAANMEKIFCENVRKALPVLEKNIPVLVVAIPHGKAGGALPYFGTSPDREAFWRAMDCIGQAPIQVLKLKAEFSSLEKYLISDHYHLNAEGTRLLAAEITQHLPENLQASKPALEQKHRNRPR